MKTYLGSCHCGAVRFEADIDLSLETLRCNCSMCKKIRWWAAIVKPESFRLLCGASELGDYQFHRRVEHHLFCRHCGVRPFSIGQSPRLGKFYGVSVACLDGVSDEELSWVPVRYVDGRNDEWDQAPAETGYL
ncbi:GFA family protein [Massilia rubra]|uniref:GFA family protein n=1 Tax=Massilia rubra TaxID=2607910 RepID=A0ABX0LI96_9BURK|nr:GFA family protein [Massilia rubra]NHZ32485.1 GFA family protein [Massilia rubra]